MQHLWQIWCYASYSLLQTEQAKLQFLLVKSIKGSWGEGGTVRARLGRGQFFFEDYFYATLVLLNGGVREA